MPPRGTRPTTDRVREAVFSRLEHLGAVADAQVLDLFAGSGALGLEAASRGAARVVLVDSARSAVEVARRNIRDLGLSGVEVRQAQAERFVLDPPTRPWDLVFLDPPYDLADAAMTRILTALAAPGVVSPGATVVVERSARTIFPGWPTGWSAAPVKRYGETAVYLAEVGPVVY